MAIVAEPDQVARINVGTYLIYMVNGKDATILCFAYLTRSLPSDATQHCFIR